MDDFVICSETEDECWAALSELKQMFTKMGFNINEAKSSSNPDR